MLNHVVLVGRLVRVPEIYKTDSGKSISTMTLAVTRPYKNVNGEYESDFIECTIWEETAENVVEYVKKGDLVGIKGHLGSYQVEKENEKYHRANEVVVERVTFLTPSSKEESKPTKKEKN